MGKSDASRSGMPRENGVKDIRDFKVFNDFKDLNDLNVFIVRC